MPSTVDPPAPDVAHPNALNVRYTPNPDGWVTAQIVEIPAVISQGRDESEAFANLLAAARDFTHTPTRAERVATTLQARVIEPLFALLHRA